MEIAYDPLTNSRYPWVFKLKVNGILKVMRFERQADAVKEKLKYQAKFLLRR